MQNKQYVWYNGKFVDFKDANVHVLTHSLQYGSGIFEGLRAYDTGKGTAIFRLKEHVKRLFNTAKIYKMDLGFTPSEIENAAIAATKKNGLKESYIRPFAFYDDNHIGLNVAGKKVSLIIASVAFGSYFKNKNKGIKCIVSSWKRINSSILPPEAKASGNYINSVLSSIEANALGADEAILLGLNDNVAEGPGENLFLVEDGILITPSRASDILMGITRDSIIKIAENLGLEVEEREVHREELYIADELFFTGTAAELTPIINVDSRKVGTGAVGPITKTLSTAFSDVILGKNSEFKQWLTYI